MSKAAGLPPIREAEFMGQVIQLARLRGWKVAHFRPARTSKGWRTPCQADAKGWPDLVLVKASVSGFPGRIIFAELKRHKKQELTPEQANWLWLLESAGMSTVVWTPEDWAQIFKALES